MIDEESLRSAISANVVRLRKGIGWSQEELGARSGISRVFMSRIENGHSTPGADVLYALADALGVSTDALRQVAEKISQKSA